MQKLQAAEMRFLSSVKESTKLDKIRNEDIRKELGVFSISDRIRQIQKIGLTRGTDGRRTSAEAGSLVQDQRKKRSW
jgi:hypothetical protein